MRSIRIAKLCAVSDMPLPSEIFGPVELNAACDALAGFTEPEINEKLGQAGYDVRSRLAVKMRLDELQGLELKAMHKPVKNLKANPLHTDAFYHSPELAQAGFVPGQVYAESEASALLKKYFGNDKPRQRMAGKLMLEQLGMLMPGGAKSATPETDRFLRQQRRLGI